MSGLRGSSTEAGLGPLVPLLADAWLSDCGTYRYTLGRFRPADTRPLAWVMLNPSTADASKDDPTIRKVLGFTRRAAYDALWVVNLYAFRATKPSALRDVICTRGGAFAEGPENRGAIRSVAMNANAIVCAWGATPWAASQAASILDLLRATGKPLFCLGTTKDGSPIHPLMPSYDGHPLVPFGGPRG